MVAKESTDKAHNLGPNAAEKLIKQAGLEISDDTDKSDSDSWKDYY